MCYHNLNPKGDIYSLTRLRSWHEGKAHAHLAVVIYPLLHLELRAIFKILIRGGKCWDFALLFFKLHVHYIMLLCIRLVVTA